MLKIGVRGILIDRESTSDYNYKFITESTYPLVSNYKSFYLY
jgi:hypothetical protein